MRAQPGRVPSWLIPAVFAAVTLSLPVQMMVASRIGEPYPGLFFPKFSTVPDLSDGFQFNEVRFALPDGQQVQAQKVLGVAEVNRIRRLATRYFPRHPHGPVVLPQELRESILHRISVPSEPPPRQLEVTWVRRRYDLETREISDVRTLVSYPVDLGDSGP